MLERISIVSSTGAGLLSSLAVRRLARIPIILLSIAVLAGLLFLFTFFRPIPEIETEIYIPAQTDWVDYGSIFGAGRLGEWDYRLWGAFTNTVIKKDGKYYLYYQGASGYRVVPDETVLWRAIGVATSTDGINFSKYEDNPVLTWFPSGYPAGNGEEGAVSGGVTLDEDGQIAIVYGANTAYSPTGVRADGRFATSSDGHAFEDHGVVLDHGDSRVWAARDELFPIATIQDSGRWFVYYLPNGSLFSRKLGVAWGSAPDNLSHSSAARSGFRMIPAWGTAGYGEVAPDVYALFLNDGTQGIIEVRLVDLDRPDRLGSPIQTYAFPDARQATVFLDKEANTWFMYYRQSDGYGVKLAPAGEIDKTPPTPPAQVWARPLNDRQIHLTWEPAQDADTGIAQYKIYRDGTEVATVKGWSYIDSGLSERTAYRYRVIAVNYHGTQGSGGKGVSTVTLPDTSPPTVQRVHAAGDLRHVTIEFDEPVAAAMAQTADNYQISGLWVRRAIMGGKADTVTLETSNQEPERVYTLTIKSIEDKADTPNALFAVEKSFTAAAVPGLLGAWHFDEGRGDDVIDTGNSGSNGTLLYRDVPGPQWTAGVMGGALSFDGLDDQVTVPGSGPLQTATDGSYTYAAWARPDRLPSNRTVNDRFFTIIARNYNGLYYDEAGRFRAQIELADGAEVAVSSPPVEPGEWHHVVMTIDRDKQALHLYLDGREVPASPETYAGSLAPHGDAPYYIGTSEPLAQLYEYRFQGTIDEVRIFGRPLDVMDIQTLAASLP